MTLTRIGQLYRAPDQQCQLEDEIVDAILAVVSDAIERGKAGKADMAGKDIKAIMGVALGEVALNIGAQGYPGFATHLGAYLSHPKLVRKAVLMEEGARQRETNEGRR